MRKRIVRKNKKRIDPRYFLYENLGDYDFVQAAVDLNELLGGPYISEAELAEAHGDEIYQIVDNAIDQTGHETRVAESLKAKAYAILEKLQIRGAA